MLRRYINISPLRFILLNLLTFFPFGFGSACNFYFAFSNYNGSGYSFCFAIVFATIHLFFYYLLFLVETESIDFEKNGIRLHYIFKKQDRFINFQEMEGYYTVKEKSKGQFIGYKAIIVTKNNQQFAIVQGFKESDQLLDVLSSGGIKSIPKRFPHKYYMLIPVFLSIIGTILLGNEASNYSEAAGNKSDTQWMKGRVEKELFIHKSKGDQMERGVIFLKGFPNEELFFNLDNVTDKDAYESLNMKKDTATYFFQISKKSYNLRFAKTVKPNFFQKYFNDRIEIYGMRSYQKTYFEVFK